MTPKKSLGLSPKSVKFWTTTPTPLPPIPPLRKKKVRPPLLPIIHHVPEDYSPAALQSTAYTPDGMLRLNASLITSLEDVKLVLGALEVAFSKEFVHKHKIAHLVEPTNIP